MVCPVPLVGGLHLRELEHMSSIGPMPRLSVCSAPDPRELQVVTTAVVAGVFCAPAGLSARRSLACGNAVFYLAPLYNIHGVEWGFFILLLLGVL